MLSTQAPSHKTDVGQTRAQLWPRILASKMVLAEPRRLPVRIWRINWGTSIPVGQAFMQGASWQNRHREPSSRACPGLRGGLMSAKFFSSCSSASLGAASLDIGTPLLLATTAKSILSGARFVSETASCFYTDMLGTDSSPIKESRCTNIIPRKETV